MFKYFVSDFANLPPRGGGVWDGPGNKWWWWWPGKGSIISCTCTRPPGTDFSRLSSCVFVVQHRFPVDFLCLDPNTSPSQTDNLFGDFSNNIHCQTVDKKLELPFSCRVLGENKVPVCSMVLVKLQSICWVIVQVVPVPRQNWKRIPRHFKVSFFL